MDDKIFWEKFKQYKASTAKELGVEVTGILSDYDELTAITLKAHLFVEEQMNEMLGKFMHKDTARKFSFDNKLKILTSTELIGSPTHEAINYLNEIRNDYSHQLEFKVSEQRLETLINKMIQGNEDYFEEMIRTHTRKNLEFNERYTRAVSLISAFTHYENVNFYNKFSLKSQDVLNEERRRLEQAINDYD